MNKHGIKIEHAFYPMRERYHYDFNQCRSEDGWIQYDTDQDAWYFGVWVHPEKRVIISFAEGDETITTYQTDESYHAELAHMAEVYGPPPPAMIGIDRDGTVTKYYDTRPE